jgi:tetratricopeptide (TPR) repeat protein
VAIDRAAVLRNAEKLLRQGKLESAISEYVRVVEDQPNDSAAANTLGDLYVRAGHAAKGIEQFARLADSFADEGFLSKAAALYKKILKIQPDDERALVRAGEIAASLGVLVDARAYFNAVVHRRLARNDREGAAEITRRLASLDPRDVYGKRSAVQAPMKEVAEKSSGGSPLLDVAIERLQAGSFDEALTIFRQLLNQDPARADSVVSLGCDLALTSPDAGYRMVAMAAETAVIEGDWTSAAQALQRLVARIPNHAPALMRLVEICSDGGLDAASFGARADAGAAEGSNDRFEISADASDLESLIAEIETQVPTAAVGVQFDITGLPEEGEAVRGTVESMPIQSDPCEAPSLDDVFERFRAESSQRAGSRDAEREYERGIALREVGRTEESVRSLETASRSPLHRFRAAAALGRLHKERGALPLAIEWFERAAQAPAPAADEAHELFYELADSLESVGETARALAICLELHADAGEYRDVSVRINRLTKAQARG